MHYHRSYRPRQAATPAVVVRENQAPGGIDQAASTQASPEPGRRDPANKLLTAGNAGSPNPITYTWDANGNQTSKTVNEVTTTYVWDYADSENLTDKMTQLHDGVTMSFTTDADGFRRSLTKDGATTHFLYDRRSNVPGLDPLIAELDATGATTQTYVHANGLLPTRPSTLPYPRWYHFEAIGSTRQLTEWGEGVTDEYSLESFRSTAATSGVSANPFGYVGRHGCFEDSQSTLVLLGVRWLCPDNSAFITSDPDRAGSNWYSYAGGKPTRLADPTGLAPKKPDPKVIWCQTDPEPDPINPDYPWQNAGVGTPLLEGCRVRTGSLGEVEVTFADGKATRQDELSNLAMRYGPGTLPPKCPKGLYQSSSGGSRQNRLRR